jgi:site-specific recombinase XerD
VPSWRCGGGRLGRDRARLCHRRARHASLPPHLSSEQLARLLERPAAPRPAEYRDRAILLLAHLGLRAGEVTALDLDDLDWRAGQLRSRAGKCRREQVLPLPQEVGTALAEYLRHGRPPCPERRVFLALTDPVWAFQPTAVTRIVQRNLVRAGIPLGRLTGAHMLRHTAASRMVNRGASFKISARSPGRSISITSTLRRRAAGPISTKRTIQPMPSPQQNIRPDHRPFQRHPQLFNGPRRSAANPNAVQIRHTPPAFSLF